MDALRRTPKLVTVFGGSGFIGRHVVRALAKRDYRVRVAVRRPNLAFFLQPLGKVGQIQLVQANLRFPHSIAAATEGADAVVNLVGLLAESGRQRFEEVMAHGAADVAAVTPAGAPLVHVSAIGADLTGDSLYARAKARGEAAIRSARPDATILRPSLVFGEGDGLFNRFAQLARALPILPIAGADTKFQPVFVNDVAEMVAMAVDGVLAPGQTWELGGPEVKTMREIVDYVLAVTERKRVVVPLPHGLADLQARILSIVDTLTLGLMPPMLKLTRDQVASLQVDNIVSEAATAEGRTLVGAGLTPLALEAIVPSYLTRYRKTGQFDIERAA